MEYVGDLFAKNPAQWGYRGDPYLWAEMQQGLATTRLPDTESALQDILEVAFHRATGGYLIDGEDITIDRFPRRGMSGGVIYGTFWKDKAVPLLIDRFTAEVIAPK